MSNVTDIQHDTVCKLRMGSHREINPPPNPKTRVQWSVRKILVRPTNILLAPLPHTRKGRERRKGEQPITKEKMNA